MSRREDQGWQQEQQGRGVLPQQPVAVVTGAAGFIGSALCGQLQQAGYRVRALVRPGTGTRAGNIPADECQEVALHAMDLGEAFLGAEVVCHLAAIAHTGFRNRDRLHLVNVQGTAAVIAACRAAAVSRLLHFSSILAQTADTPYARSKLESEQLAMNADGPDLSVAVLRPVSVYGPGMRGNLLSMARMISRRRLPPLPRLDNRFALVALDDVCRAAVLLAARQDLSGQIYVLSDGQEYTPNTIEAAIYNALGREKPQHHSPRVLFLAAAALAEVAGRLGLTRGGFGLATWRSLSTDSPAVNNQLHTDLGFSAECKFEQQLPLILEQADLL